MTAVKQKQTFRMSWLRVYAAVTFWAILVFFLQMFLRLIAGHYYNGAFVAVRVLSALLLGVVFAVLLAVCFPVHLSHEGLNGFNFWGFRQTILWEDMASATPLRFMNLPWLIVRSHRTKSALWLPLFFDDNRKFREAVSQFAPPKCPLADFGQTMN